MTDLQYAPNHNMLWKILSTEDSLEKFQEYIKKNPSFKPSQAINVFGWNALHTACHFGRLSIVKYLVDVMKADTNALSNEQWNCAIFAASMRRKDILGYLLFEAETRPNLKQKSIQGTDVFCHANIDNEMSIMLKKAAVQDD